MSYELAQLNVATLLAPLDSPVLAGFVSELDRINALADVSPGFVWRPLSDDDTPDTAQQFFDDNVITNLSVWKSADALHDYVYRTAHASVMSRRKEWFEKMSEVYFALWWVPEGHKPSFEEARAKLDSLRKNGPNKYAFTFKTRFPAPIESE